MLKIKPVRGALALLLAVSLCLAMSLTAFLIDTPAMREHAEQAVDLLGYESASPEIVGGFASSRLDNYTAVLILKTAAYIGDDPLLRMAFSGLRTDLPPQEDQTDWEAYATYSDAVPSPNNVPYSRYWHGYTFALRLLLCLFTFTNLQMLLLFAQTALLLWTVLLMVRRGLQQLIPAFAVSWFFMSPPALGLCLQYAPVSLIALLACSLLLALKPALSRSVGLPVFFALIGLFVNYFDLLTFPVVSLSFPLILLIALETKTTISFGGLMREALLCCVGWALGYACMWMLKWGLNFLVLGQDGIAAVGDQISLRLSAGGESHSRLDILLRNIRIVTDKTAYRVILLAVLVLGLVVIFGLFRVRKLVISGNKQYKAEEIQEAIMQDGLCKNSLYLLWKFSDQAKVKESILFLNGAEAKLRTPFEVQVTVKEKQQIGYLLNQGSYIYFDKDGMIVEISDQPSEDVPLITGLDVEKAELYEKLPVKDEGMYNTIVTLTKTLNKDGLVPNEIRFNTRDTITLVFEDIKVNLGDDTDLEDKMSALNSIYAQLDGRHGTLYMESYSENSGQVTFKNESGGTEDLASTDGSSESETSTQETQEGGGRMYSKTDGTFSTDANGNKTYTDAAGVTTTQCDEYNYTDENGNIITDGYGYIDPYTGSYIN